MRLRGRENELELLNRRALEMARQVADKHGKLMAGNLSNNPLYDPAVPATHEQVYEMMKVSTCRKESISNQQFFFIQISC